MMFPDFNLYSCSLLFVSLQGLMFALLLFIRFFKNRDRLDLILAMILFVTVYDQVSYCLGFLGWYDTFRFTKINYFFVNVHIILAPLIFLYIRSICKPHINLSIKDAVHFIPFIALVIIKAGIYWIDSGDSNFHGVQNGQMVTNFQWRFFDPLVVGVTILLMPAYMYASFRMLTSFREKVRQYFSNSFKLEVRWLFVFVIIYSLLFIYQAVEIMIDHFVVDLHWRQEWYYFILSGIALIYMGIKGYFIDLHELKNIEVKSFIEENDAAKESTIERTIENQTTSETKAAEQEMDRIAAYMGHEKPYLDPRLTLVKLAKQLQISREELSLIINSGFGKKFNAFINQYRVEEFKSLVSQGKHLEYSILGLAYECGFNSKATFNRSFRKEEETSPSAYIQKIDNQ